MNTREGGIEDRKLLKWGREDALAYGREVVVHETAETDRRKLVYCASTE